jgi:hypothetical protein
MYEVSCENGHSQELTATELERLIRSGEYECPNCEKTLTLTSDLDLECYICADVSNVSDLGEASNTMESRCMACEQHGLGECSIHVRDSWEYFEAEYYWRLNGLDEKPLQRKGRTDYWEAVIHFCEVDEFVSSYKQRKIGAGVTGYFRVPAVCLTEAPAGNWKDLQRRHGSFGYVFLKRDLIAAGGGPAVYLSEMLIDAQEKAGGFSNELKPFVNLLRISSTPDKRKHDFLHEREWRLPRDLSFNRITSGTAKTVQPYAIVVGDYNAGTKDWKHIWSARCEFEELVDHVGEDMNEDDLP